MGRSVVSLAPQASPFLLTLHSIPWWQPAGCSANMSAKQAASRVGRIAQEKSYKKYTVQPQGIWAKINQFFAIDSKRSTGVPLNPHYRLPTPGGNEPTLYDDPVTVPAGDKQMVTAKEEGEKGLAQFFE